ncbi:MAG: pyridoxal-phosphate dependent enzyme [Desulfocapsaceae bacterium]
MNLPDLHSNSPLLESLPLSNCAGSPVWLKLEALQPSGSFKLRGIGRACQHYVNQGARGLVSSSGGNAGIAVAYSGRKLSVPVTVVVPQSTTRRAMEAIRAEGAELVVFGESWQEAHQRAKEIGGTDRMLIHPFDDPLIWDGHATMIDEIATAGLRPDIVVLSVGGGGLLCGVIEGLHRNNLGQVPVLAVETAGAASLAASLQTGKHIEIDHISSIATSLGAKKVAQRAFEYCSNHPVVSHVVSDGEALDACLQFAGDHRLLVEPACGASLAAVYQKAPHLVGKNNILLIVCGGAGVSIAQLHQWQEGLEEQGS